jgi:predicted permease
MYMATSGYFETMGVPRIAGRDFADEGTGAPRVAVVNEAFAQSFFPNGNALGQHVRDGGRIYQIIGVVGNIKSRTLGEDVRPVLYRALAQDLGADPSVTGYTVVVQFSRDAGALGNAVRREIHSLDPALAVFDVGTMDEHVRDALFLPRLAGTLFGVFGFIGLALAGVGLYGVISYSVSRRTREIGIRLAVGAQSSEVQRLIIRQGMVLTGAAVVPGLAAAWALTRLFSSFLYGVPAHDGATFTIVPVFLAAVAFLACWIPSRRAARLDPSITLRHE